jgi:glycosyltransferase involved in cell wall biosynthesis
MGLFGSPLAPDRAAAQRLGLAGADVVGFIGSFYDYEGLDDLIAAMPLLLDKRPKAHLLLVGGGPMEEALKGQAERSPVRRRIHFIGRVPHEEVDRYYSLIDVLAYPRKAMRLTELVTPLKPLEAMAQRKLVVASNVGGHRELIEDGVTGACSAPAIRRRWRTRSMPCSPIGASGSSAATSPDASSKPTVTGRQIFRVTFPFIKN